MPGIISCIFLRMGGILIFCNRNKRERGREGKEKKNDEWEMRIQNKKGGIGENIEGKEERNGRSRKNKRKRRKGTVSNIKYLYNVPVLIIFISYMGSTSLNIFKQAHCKAC